MKKVFDNFKDKISNINKLNISINKEKYIFLGIISIFLVVILLMGNTYSLFKSSNVDEDLHVYKTGVLEVTYTLSDDNVMIDTKSSTSLEDSEYINPYRLIVTNTGNVAYKFNVILSNTTASNVINSQYIMTKVGKLEPVSLVNCTNNIIKSDVIVPAGDQVIVDVRVWLSNTVQNTEMGKSFYAKLSIDGLAVYNENNNIDNSDLRADYPLLSEAEPGSYVRYIGNNGCTGDHCSGINANSSSTSNGYCGDAAYIYNSSGWRVAYSKSGNTYIVSAGSPECMCTNSDGTTSNSSCSTHEPTTGAPLHVSNLDNASLKYCNAGFVNGGLCNTNMANSLKDENFQIMTGSNLAECFSNTIESCGHGNDLIEVGGYYWFATGTTVQDVAAYSLYNWAPHRMAVRYSASLGLDGVRPIIKLDPSVEIIDGKGTENDPYIIENPNTIKDLSGNMNNGVPVNSRWNEKAGTVTINGVDGYVNMGLKNYDFDNTVSLILRFKLNSLPELDVKYQLLGNWETAGFGIEIKNSSDNGYSFIFNPYIQELSSYYYAIYYPETAVKEDIWYTLVGTYDGTTIKLYLDGTLVASTSVSGTIKPSIANVALGANPPKPEDDYLNYSNATFDYALIYDRAITEDEVTSNFSGGEINSNNINKEQLLAFYNFGSDTVEDDTVYLNEVKAGSYVKYIGNNGCTGDVCKGVYSSTNSREFDTKGWRVAYTDSTNAYLVSAGSLEYLCTNSDGTTSNSSCSSYINTGGAPVHISNLSAASLKYCNAGFSHNSICDNNSIWTINNNDFTKIIGKTLTDCSAIEKDTTCGYNNDLIDNKGWYWFATPYNASSSVNVFDWAGSSSYVGGMTSKNLGGVRAVTKLDSMVEVVGGKGTENDPYIIENPNTIKDLSGNMNNGALINNPVWDKTKGKLTTNGVDSYVNMGLANYDFGNSVTLATKIQIKEVKYGTIINNQEDGGMHIYLNPTSLCFSFGIYIDGAYYYFHSTLKPELNAWYNIVAVYDGTNLALYSNGELLTLDTSIASSTSTKTGNIGISTMPFYLGNNPQKDGIPYVPGNVKFDYVLIYDRALTEKEITDNFSGNSINNSTLDKTDLLVYYDFEG